jgi:hypothetical protein
LIVTPITQLVQGCALDLLCLERVLVVLELVRVLVLLPVLLLHVALLSRHII